MIQTLHKPEFVAVRFNSSSVQAVIFGLCAVKTTRAVITANKSGISLWR